MQRPHEADPVQESEKCGYRKRSHFLYSIVKFLGSQSLLPFTLRYSSFTVNRESFWLEILMIFYHVRVQLTSIDSLASMTASTSAFHKIADIVPEICNYK